MQFVSVPLANTQIELANTVPHLLRIETDNKGEVMGLKLFLISGFALFSLISFCSDLPSKAGCPEQLTLTEGFHRKLTVSYLGEEGHLKQAVIERNPWPLFEPRKITKNFMSDDGKYLVVQTEGTPAYQVARIYAPPGSGISYRNDFPRLYRVSLATGKVSYINLGWTPTLDVTAAGGPDLKFSYFYPVPGNAYGGWTVTGRVDLNTLEVQVDPDP